MDSSRMNRGCCGANNMQNRRAASNNMELKMEPRNFPRKMQHVDPQMPSREKLLAWIDQVSFAVVEMNLYLDTHPEDEDALAFFREKVELRKEALKQYAEQYGPLTIDTANDRMSRSFEWVMQPWPWEVNRKGGC